ncbi:MAG TPA: c-type cytochrome [Euzebyales bacterium]
MGGRSRQDATRRTGRGIAGWALLVVIVAACTAPATRSQQVGAGEPEIGRRLISDYGCVSCHVVPGVAAEEPAYVGPPLEHWGQRSYIAGALTNNQQNLVRWIVDPQAVEPGTAMPDLDVSEQDATNIAAYLLSQE